MLNRLFIPVLGFNRQCQRGKASGAKDARKQETADADAQPVAQGPNEFHIVLGETEKCLLEGKLLYPSDIVLKIDGEDARPRFRASVESGMEIYETELGTAEKLAVRIERETGAAFRAKLRIIVNGRLAQVCQIRPKWGRRHLFFQAALPSIFLLLLGYYFLSSGTQVVNFYSGIFSRPHTQVQQRHPAKVRAVPATGTQNTISDASANIA